jgi:taurine dioxygenase
MAFQVSPLPGQSGFGAIVTGLTPGDLDKDGVKASLRALWIKAGVIVFRGLEGGEDSHLRLSRIFGTLQDHMMFRDQPDYHPELIELRYTGEQETYEVDGEDRGAWLPWHSDLIYTDRINRGGILRPIVLPKSGGETGFIDRINAYATLPEELKTRFEGLNVLYLPDFDATHQKHGRAASLRLTRTTDRMQAAIAQKLPRTIHPLVYRQPETGRKVLNVSPWFANAIEGMENAEGDAILKAAIEHLIRPDLAYFHEWEPEDMVLWDNWRMTHSAKGVPTDDRRVMQRTTIAGDYALGRIEGAEPFPDALRIEV